MKYQFITVLRCKQTSARRYLHIQTKQSNTGIQTKALFLTTCWLKSNIHWHFLRRFVRQTPETSGCSGFLEVWLCTPASQILWLSTVERWARSRRSGLRFSHAWNMDSVCPQFNVRGSTRAAVTQQRGDGEPKQFRERGLSCQDFQTLCNFSPQVTD